MAIAGAFFHRSEDTFLVGVVRQNSIGLKPLIIQPVPCTLQPMIEAVALLTKRLASIAWSVGFLGSGLWRLKRSGPAAIVKLVRWGIRRLTVLQKS